MLLPVSSDLNEGVHELEMEYSLRHKHSIKASFVAAIHFVINAMERRSSAADIGPDDHEETSGNEQKLPAHSQVLGDGDSHFFIEISSGNILIFVHFYNH